MDMHIPTGNGKAETLADYAVAVELLSLGTPTDTRPLLGPRLVAELQPEPLGALDRGDRDRRELEVGKRSEAVARSLD